MADADEDFHEEVETNTTRKRKKNIHGFRSRHGGGTISDVTSAYPDQQSALGVKYPSSFIKADNDRPDFRTLAFGFSYDEARRAEDERDVACFVASALAAFAPPLEQHLRTALTRHSIAVENIMVPSRARHSNLFASEVTKLDAIEINTIAGLFFMLLFKNVAAANYSAFISNRFKALAGRLGMRDSAMKAFTLPLKLDQARAVRSLLGNQLELKRAVIECLMAFAKRSDVAANMAQYTLQILAYSEMALFQFIYEKICIPGSPVLYNPAVQAEAVKFYQVMSKAANSSYPQFFRYFCSTEDLELLSRNNFQLLGAVAQSIKNVENPGRATTRLFVSTLNESKGIVKEMTDDHINFVRRMKIKKKRRHLKFATAEVESETDEDETRQV